MVHRAHKKGFSLLEGAIVIGLIGLIIAGSAIAMSALRNSSQAQLFQQQTLDIVTNVRNYYGLRALPTCTLQETTAATFTTTLRNASVFPESMCAQSCVSAINANVLHAYGGLTFLNIPTATSPCATFRINFQNVARRGCVKLIGTLSDNAATVGLISIRVNAGTTRTSFPLTIANIRTDCSAESTNSLDLVFHIRN